MLILFSNSTASRNILMGILRISFLYGLRLAKTILCLRASPGLRFSHLYPFPILTGVVIWPGSYQDCQKKRHRFRCLFYLAASYTPRFTTDLAVFLMGNPKDFLSIMTYSPRKQYFVSAPSISACVLNFRVGRGATTMSCRCWLPFN